MCSMSLIRNNLSIPLSFREIQYTLVVTTDEVDPQKVMVNAVPITMTQVGFSAASPSNL